MDWTIQRRTFGAGVTDAAPPRWAVRTVRCCVVGILLLPVVSLAWAVTCAVTESCELTPLAFGVVITLAVGLFSTAAFLTTAYPPVHGGRGR